MSATFDQLVEFLTSIDAQKRPHSGTVSHLGHSIGVYRDLRKWGYDEDVARAGLFHSIYGTSRVRSVSLAIERRDELRALIGERAERLAYLNCSIDYETFDAAVERGKAPFRTMDRLSGEWVELAADDFEDVVKIQLVERLEQLPRTNEFAFRRESFGRMATRLGLDAERKFREVFPPDPLEHQNLSLFGRIWSVLQHEGVVVAVKRTVQALLWPMLMELVDRKVADALGRAEEKIGDQARSIAGLAETVGNIHLELGETLLPTAPAFTIVMPIRNRAHLLPRAIDSVLRQTYRLWELIIVDDGSTDKFEAAITPYEADPRIRVFRQEHRGASAARNVALDSSQGDLIGYLDSDCVMYPGALDAAWKGFEGAAATECVYLAQHRFNLASAEGAVLADRFDRRALMNLRCHIDLNAFFHRRSALERCGGFDVKLSRLQDLDLILRYTERANPVFVPALVGRYESGHFGITESEPLEPNLSRVLSKWNTGGRRPPRVLYVAYNHPQLSESYVRFEIDEMQRRGADIAVWSEDTPAAPYEASEDVFNGSIAAAAVHIDPDVVHVHWSHFAEQNLDALLATGAPVTIRGHGFDFSTTLINRLLHRPTIKRIYLYPHHADQCSQSPKIVAAPVALPVERFRPDGKNRKMVLRAAALLATKDLELFVRVAKRLPEFQFVLCLARVHDFGFAAEFLKFVEEQGSPIDIRFDVPHEECFELFRQAGIYLHTFGPTDPFGMPISIGQALAAECCPTRDIVNTLDRAHGEHFFLLLV